MDISTKDFANIYRECTAEPYSFLVNDTSLASNNPLRFRKKKLTYIIKIMTINDQIIDERLQYDINREAKYLLYHQVIINVNTLQVKIYYRPINSK